LNFGKALEAMKAGSRVTREAWQDTAHVLVKKDVAPGGDASLPYILEQTVQGETVPWTFPHSEVLAEDWQILL
jgi:hypothetical protein